MVKKLGGYYRSESDPKGYIPTGRGNDNEKASILYTKKQTGYSSTTMSVISAYDLLFWLMPCSPLSVIRCGCRGSDSFWGMAPESFCVDCTACYDVAESFACCLRSLRSSQVSCILLGKASEKFRISFGGLCGTSNSLLRSDGGCRSFTTASGSRSGSITVIVDDISLICCFTSTL